MSIATLSSQSKDDRSLSQPETLYEIVFGQRVELAPMSFFAALLASRLHGILWPYVRDNKLGVAVMEALFILDVENNLRRRPDVAFVSAASWPLDKAFPEVGDLPVVPDLVVEVVSPSDIFQEVVGKIGEYFEHGVKEAWLVVPSEHKLYVYESSVDVTILQRNAHLQDRAVVPGFSLDLAQLFKKSEQ